MMNKRKAAQKILLIIFPCFETNLKKMTKVYVCRPKNNKHQQKTYIYNCQN